jgi:hypothetical protein
MPSRADVRLPRPVTGLSYRRPAAAIATVLTLAVFGYGGRLLAADAGLPALLMLVLIAGAVAMAINCWFIVFGTTTVDADGIRQAGMVERAWRWDEIERVRLVRMPWSTRLALMPARGPVRIVHAGTPQLDEAFETIAAMYSRDGP